MFKNGDKVLYRGQIYSILMKIKGKRPCYYLQPQEGEIRVTYDENEIKLYRKHHPLTKIFE